MPDSSQLISSKITRIRQLVRDGKLDEAIIRLEAMIAVHPNVKELYLLVCKFYTAAGKRTDIPLEWLKKAKEIEPELELYLQKMEQSAPCKVNAYQLPEIALP